MERAAEKCRSALLTGVRQPSFWCVVHLTIRSGRQQTQHWLWNAVPNVLESGKAVPALAIVAARATGHFGDTLRTTDAVPMGDAAVLPDSVSRIGHGARAAISASWLNWAVQGASALRRCSESRAASAQDLSWRFEDEG